MKKITLIAALCLIVTVAFPNALANTRIDIDSSDVSMILKTGVQIANHANKQIVPFLPNEATSAILTVIFGAIFRFFEKRRVEKRIREEKKNLE